MAAGLPVGVLVLWVLTSPVQLYYARPFYRSALAAARHRTANMDTLVTVGTSAAYGYSVFFIVVSLLIFTIMAVRVALVGRRNAKGNTAKRKQLIKRSHWGAFIVLCCD